MEDSLAKEEAARKELEGQLAKMVAEKNDVFMQLQQEKSTGQSSEEKAQKLQSQKNDLDRQLHVR